MKRRAVLGSILPASALAGCASWPQLGDSPTFSIESLSVEDEADDLTYETQIHDRSVRQSSPGWFTLELTNQRDVPIIVATGAPERFGLLSVTPSADGRHDTSKLYFWSDTYDTSGSDVRYDAGTFTVTSQILHVVLAPGERTSREFQVRSDRDLGPLRATRYGGRYEYEYQFDENEWRSDVRPRTTGFSLTFDLVETS